ERRRGRRQVVGNDDRRIRVLERGGTGQQVKRGASQRVLIGARVDVGALQLLGGAVSGGSHRHVGRGQATDLTHLARDAEIGQQNASSRVGITEQDVRRLDV